MRRKTEKEFSAFGLPVVITMLAIRSDLLLSGLSPAGSVSGQPAFSPLSQLSLRVRIWLSSWSLSRRDSMNEQRKTYEPAMKNPSLSIIKKAPFGILSGHSFSKTICAGAIMLLSALASAQNLFVLASTNTSGFPPSPPAGLILEITPKGSESIFVSGLTPSFGLTFAAAGNLFEADNGSGNIYEFTNHGSVLFSNRVTFAAGLYEPQGLSFDSAGNLFEVDLGSHNANTGIMHKFMRNGAGSVTASGLNPAALAIDRSNNVYVADIQSQSIYEFTSNGVESTFVSGLSNPYGLAFDSKGDLFEADDGSGSIYEFINSGGILSSNYVIFAAGLSLPHGLVFDNAGDLFVADQGSGNIYKFTKEGIRSTFASGLLDPTGLAFQPIPELKAIAINGTVQITVSMPSPYYSTIIQTSTNLESWFNICTNTPPFTLTNSMTTTFPNCFYRGLLGP